MITTDNKRLRQSRIRNSLFVVALISLAVLLGYLARENRIQWDISQNERNFAPQGSLNVTGPEGFYVGAWASQVDFTPGPGNDPQVELDIYGGKHTDLWGIDWNFEPYYYAYPSEPNGYNADYFEIQNQFTKAF